MRVHGRKAIGIFVHVQRADTDGPGRFQAFDRLSVFAGDRRMFNPYGVMLVNPARHPQVKVKQGLAFIDWLTGTEGQATIADYKINGAQLFFPDAKH